MKKNHSIFKSAESESAYLNAYEAILEQWPVAYASRELPTQFGVTHLLMSGPVDSSPLILLPGNYSSSISWFPIIESLSIAHRVYALDTIGDIGKSVTIGVPANRDEYARWLLEVLDGLGIVAADILGISYGGYLATNFALRHPNRLSHLTLLCPGIPFAPFTFRWLYRGMPMMLFPSRTVVKWFVQGASTRKISEDLALEAFITGVTCIHPAKPLRPLIRNDEWERLCIPTLLLIGDHEIMYDARKAISRARELVPHIQAELVENAAHFLLSDQPEKISEIILRFLNT